MPTRTHTQRSQKNRTPLRHLRLEDGPDAIPMGRARNADVPAAGIYANLGFALPGARELFRVRTRSELYPQWYVDFVDDTRVTQIAAVDADVYDWDCMSCKRSVLTYRLADPCPCCGAR